MYNTVALVRALRGVGSWGRFFRIRKRRGPPMGANKKKRYNLDPELAFDQETELFFFGSAACNSRDDMYPTRW